VVVADDETASTGRPHEAAVWRQDLARTKRNPTADLDPSAHLEPSRVCKWRARRDDRSEVSSNWLGEPFEFRVGERIGVRFLSEYRFELSHDGPIIRLSKGWLLRRAR
jgi:hypothetical protein